MELSIIIPCYNEEKRLLKSCKNILSYLKTHKIKSEIIFVNDGSIDQTKLVINQFCQEIKGNKYIFPRCISYAQNKGKGYAIKKGITEAKGDFILLTDADLSTPISELRKLKKFIDNYDLVIGSRKQKDSVIIKAQTPTREILGRGFSYLSKILLGVKVNDFTCGFKLFKKNQAKTIADKMTVNRWGYDSEIIKIAHIHNLKIKEIGVIWKNDEGSKVKLSADIFSSVIDLFRIIIYSKLKRYE